MLFEIHAENNITCMAFNVWLFWESKSEDTNNTCIMGIYIYSGNIIQETNIATFRLSIQIYTSVCFASTSKFYICQHRVT